MSVFRKVSKGGLKLQAGLMRLTTGVSIVPPSSSPVLGFSPAENWTAFQKKNVLALLVFAQNEFFVQ